LTYVTRLSHPLGWFADANRIGVNFKKGVRRGEPVLPRMNGEVRFIDLFSGIGGFRLGLERANSGLGAKLTTGEGGHQDKEGLSADSGGKDGNGREKHPNGYYRCVWSCDNNKYANQVYTKHFGETNHHPGDVRGIDPEDIPDFDLLCAGFPCQAFSVAGKRKGFEETRGTLFFEICRIAEAKRPPLLLLENVRGLLSHDKGLTFQIILESLEELGYWAEWQVLNSKYFGVPQNRQRVFIIGHLRGAGGREIFPIGEADGMAQGEDEGKREQISLAIDRNYWKGPDKHGQRTVVGVTLANTSRYRQGVKRTPLKKDENSFALNSTGDQGVAISFTNPHNPEEERKVNLSNLSRAVKPPYGNQQPLVLHNLYGGFKEGIRVFDKNSPTIRTSKGGGHIPSVVVLADRTRTLAGKGRNLESPKLITNALSGVQKDKLILENLKIRRLTPVECERLQGFPDGWTEFGYVKDAVLDWEPIYGWETYYDEDDQPEERWTIIGKNPIDPIENTIRISDTQRYKCLGNAVTVNVITFLARALHAP